MLECLKLYCVVNYKLNSLFEQHVKGQNVEPHAPKQRLGQSRWLLSLCWCSLDYTIRTV